MSAFFDRHKCPITHEIMKDPVLAPDTYNYEREAIVRYLQTNPISPMTRQPMNPSQLIENRQLRQEIESILAACDTETESIDQMIPDDSPVCTGEIRSSSGNVQVSITVTDGETGPLSIAFVKDTSGSMNTEVVLGVEKESDGYNMLDIACHGTNVCIKSLRPCDKAAIITFNSRANVIAPLRKMTPGNKGLAKVALAKTRPNGSTNLWDGIRMALDILPNDGIVCVLTDGAPTVRPSRGEVSAFCDWKDNHPNWKGQLHTFGFGYSLDSKLLMELAREGYGRYSFIPDSSMVGTVFVHAMANIRTTYMSRCMLSVTTNGTIKDIGPHLKTSWGYQIPIGPIMFGQRRDYFLTCSDEYSCHIDNIELEPKGQPNATNERQRTAIAIYNSLKIRPNLNDFAKSITDPKLLEDIHGQWTQAMEIDHFRRWGQHYLPSLAAAHMTQTCNNFLDKGIQTYGGARFHQLRASIDDLFNNMPAPRASLREAVEYRMQSRGQTIRAAPISMREYNNASAPCFAGYCKVTLENNITKTLAACVPGDRIYSPTGYATIIKVLKTMCPTGKTALVKINNLYVTPWHPIRLQNKWQFPANTQETIKMRNTEAVYSLLLDQPSCYIEGIECIGLAHGIENDKVASHPFFGTNKVAKLLNILDDNQSGIITLSGPEAIQRDSQTGLVCGFII